MFTSWSALESHQRALHTDYYHSLTNYISHNSLPGLVTDCIHLYLITLLVSAYLYLVHSFTHCKVVYVVALHFQAFSLVLCLLVFGFLACLDLDFLPALLPLTSVCFCLFVCWTAYLCFDLLPVRILDYVSGLPFN